MKTRSQRVLGTKSYICRGYSEKTGMGAFLSSPILRIQVQLTGHQKVFSDTKARILMAYFDGGSLWNLLTELDVCQDLK